MFNIILYINSVHFIYCVIFFSIFNIYFFYRLFVIFYFTLLLLYFILFWISPFLLLLGPRPIIQFKAQAATNRPAQATHGPDSGYLSPAWPNGLLLCLVRLPARASLARAPSFPSSSACIQPTSHAKSRAAQLACTLTSR